MQITTSPDITNLLVKATFDLSGLNPSVLVSNLSTGSGLSNVKWAFVITSPSGTFIHNGNIVNPDITGNWSTHTFSDAWPRPFNQIEFSGAAYQIYVIAQDSNGNIFQTDPQAASICRPNGNTQTSKNYYGLASSNVAVKCSEARVYFEDTTYHSYKGSDGVQLTSSLSVIYPIDETGTIPDKFQIASYSNALVPISYSSDNYQFLQLSVYEYDLGNNTFVRIKYQVIQTFAVWCNIDLEPLVCEFNKLIDSIQNGTCSDVVEANNKLSLISPKIVLVFMGIMQPLTGVDVPALIDEIKNIGGFDCDCCSAATGIIPQTSSIIDGYNFIINPVCGDISGTVTLNGTNITFNLQDKSYVVSIASESPSQTTAFSIEPSINGCQKTYALKIDAHQLSTDILNVIKNDSGLVNLFNSIVNSGGNGTSNLIVDGKCILQTTGACDYTFNIFNVPTSVTFAILTNINGNPVNFAFNQTNIAALQAYLNTLGYGTFSVTNPLSGKVVLTSLANTNNITAITYKVGGNNYISDMTKTCTGYIPKTANQVVQALIDYLCGITDAKIATSQDYVICYLDPISQTQKTVTISSGAAVTDFIIELLARGCDTINYIYELNILNCNNIKNLFPQSIDSLQANDFLLSTKNGQCARVFPVELGIQILKYGMSDVNFMSFLCNAVALCGTGKICDPFNYFYLTLPYSSPTDDTMSIVVNFSHPSAISYTLRYARVDNTTSPTYITIPNVLTSPKTLTGLADGQYTVGLTPVYADGIKCSEVTQTTTGCTGINSFSAVTGGSPTSEFIVSYNAVNTIPKVRVNIAYPNGGSFSQIYTNDGVNIHIPFPVGVYGDFSITITPVCNANTGFFGVPTAPVIVTINTAGTQGSFILANSTTNICSGTPTILYTNGVFAGIGTTIYSDPSLTIPQTGYTYIVYGGYIYAINTSSGVVTGGVGSCSSFTTNYILAGSTGYSIVSVSGTGVPSLPPTGSGAQQGHHTAMSGNYTVVMGGGYFGNIRAYVNNSVYSTIAITGDGSYTLPIIALESDSVRISA